MTGEELSAEFAGVELGDKRRNRRVQAVAKRMECCPEASLTEILSTDKELEGFYRLINHQQVNPEALLGPHRERTAKRAKAASMQGERILVIHDHSEISFGGRTTRKGLRPVRHQSGNQGFVTHVGLGVSLRGSEVRTPLGVLGWSSWTRSGASAKVTAPKARRALRLESVHWREQAHLSQSYLGVLPAWHVMDRGADDYHLYSELSACSMTFVVRGFRSRTLKIVGREGLCTLEQAAQSCPLTLERSVFLSPRYDDSASRKRSPGARRFHPARLGRKACLQIGSIRVQMQRARSADPLLVPSLPLTLVVVRESNPPEGQQPVQWLLWTNVTIDEGDTETLASIVDAYRARWIVEEYFKALKTGCRYEQKQLGSYHALQNLLALYLPVAWQLLALRSATAEQSERPASDVFSPLRMSVMARCFESSLHPSATVHEAYRFIAALGGHIKNNGPPGWLTLARGFHRLLQAESAILNFSTNTYDQS